MPHEVIMPALGMAQDTGLIVAWHKSEGDAVRNGDLLLEVETDKATMEVEALADGFLNAVHAQAGEEVPVGTVIAQIGSEATGPDVLPTEANASPATDLPVGTEVIMPALGMAQDTGLIVAWHKSPGEAVASGDILFEVETDKATMEVEAGADGYVAALLAKAGEEAPVGAPIAIISDGKPENPVQRSQAGGATAPAPKVEAKVAPEPAARPAPKPKDAPKPAPKRADGRILASPKTRRLALEQGLDLGRLVEAGHPQPYHVADLDVLRALPAQATENPTTPSRRLVADLPRDGFAGFAVWAGEAAGLDDANALLAGLAAASLGRDTTTVAVEAFGCTQSYMVPAGSLDMITEAPEDAGPDLILRDLRMSRVSSVALGSERAPVLTLTRAGAGLVITLECAGHHLTAAEAISLLSEFAGRVEQPLRHLL